MRSNQNDYQEKHSQKGTRIGSINASSTKGKVDKLPPDPDGLFERAAARGEVVMRMYDALNPDIGRNFLVGNLLFDLMHLCDRDPKLGNVDEECVYAIRMYDRFVEENQEDEVQPKRRKRSTKRC